METEAKQILYLKCMSIFNITNSINKSSPDDSEVGMKWHPLKQNCARTVI